MKQNLTQMRCFLQPVPRKLWIAFHTHNNEHPLTAMQTAMAATHRLTRTTLIATKTLVPKAVVLAA
jgi:hypothetical protein